MGIGWKALGVPLIAGAMWLLPSDRPETEVAGAVESAVLADAAPTTESAPQTSTTEGSPSTTIALTTTTSETIPPTDPPVAPVIATTSTVAPTTVTQTTVVVTPTAAVPTTAPPTTLTPVGKGEAALARVSFDWRTAFPNWLVEFRGPRNGLRALTYPEQKRIEIFVRASDTPASLHRVFAHELGHVVDVERNSDDDRQRWIAQRGIDGGTPWWPSAEAPDFATGAGDFAEAFAVWETGVTTRSSVAGQPSAADLDLIRELSRG